MTTRSRPLLSRHAILGLLILLFAITYLDRVCISVAGPRIQQELGISPSSWGWVTGIFTLAYCLFEIPSGIHGDRIGARRLLTRIVLFWSLFTAFTGAASSLSLLLLTRFFFGAGQAGAYPGSAIVISQWFPPGQRATISGVTLMAGQIGGALAPLVIIPIQARFGWRASFYAFSLLGLIWAFVWFSRYRDSPGGRKTLPSVNASETEHVTSGFTWTALLGSRTALALALTAFCYTYSYNFFQTWLHTFLARGRGFTEEGLVYSFLPFALAVCATLAGGLTSDRLARRFGPAAGRRKVGMVALTLAGLLVALTMQTSSPMGSLFLLSGAYCAITFQQASVLGVCLDISGSRAGTMLACINLVSQLGGLLGSILFGYVVEHFGSYNAPLVPMALFLLAGAALWTQVDASSRLEAPSRLQDSRLAT